jgi:hypothetical protein
MLWAINLVGFRPEIVVISERCLSAFWNALRIARTASSGCPDVLWIDCEDRERRDLPAVIRRESDGQVVERGPDVEQRVSQDDRETRVQPAVRPNVVGPLTVRVDVLGDEVLVGLAKWQYEAVHVDRVMLRTRQLHPPRGLNHRLSPELRRHKLKGPPSDG